MQRSIRSPFLPALNSAARTCLYTTGSPSTRPGPPPPPRARTPKSEAASENAAFQQTLRQMQERLRRNSGRPQDFHDLVAIEQAMGQYRACRGRARANASDLIHAILSTLRVRNIALKPLISRVRQQVVARQNERLSAFLNEIVEDIAAGRSFATRYALVYLFTAYDSMGHAALGSAAWRRLHAEPSETMRAKLLDPRVVSAALKYVDPGVLTLEELENAYAATVEAHGACVLADEALILGYLRFREFGKAVQHYALVVDRYTLDEAEDTLTRIHNEVLTACDVHSIAAVFFAAAAQPRNFVQLHPSAAANFIRVTYLSTDSTEKTVAVYLAALAKVSQQRRTFPAFNTMNMVSEVLKSIIAKRHVYDGPVPEAREQIARVLASGLDPQHSLLVLNSALSMVAKTWPASEYILELHQRYPRKLPFDALRVLLTSCAGIPATRITADQVAQWWDHLRRRKDPQIVDWLALAKACNEETRAALFVAQVQALQPDLGWLYVGELPHIARALRAIGYAVREAPTETQFSADAIKSEFAARVAAMGVQDPHDPHTVTAEDAPVALGTSTGPVGAVRTEDAVPDTLASAASPATVLKIAESVQTGPFEITHRMESLELGAGEAALAAHAEKL